MEPDAPPDVQDSMRLTLLALVLSFVTTPSAFAQSRKEPRVFSKQERSILEQTLHRATQSQDIEDLSSRSKPWWRKHRLFRVVNYTRPHCPGAKVAYGPDGKAWVISGVSAGLCDRDAPAGFNRVATAENRAIKDEEAKAYLRFVLDCYFGSFRPEHWVASTAAVRKIVARKADRSGYGTAARALGGWNDHTLDVTKTEAGWKLRGFYVIYKTLWEINVSVTAKDGTIAMTCDRVKDVASLK